MSAYPSGSVTGPPPRNSDRSTEASAQVPAQRGRGFEAKDDREQTLFSNENFPPLSKESQGEYKSNRWSKGKPYEKQKLQKAREIIQLEPEADLMEMFGSGEGPQVGGDDRDPKANSESGRTYHDENPKRSAPPRATDAQDLGSGSRGPPKKRDPGQASGDRNLSHSSGPRTSHGGRGIRNSLDRRGSEHSESQQQPRRSRGGRGQKQGTRQDSHHRKPPPTQISDAGGVQLADDDPEVEDEAKGLPRSGSKGNQRGQHPPRKSQRSLETSLEKKNQELDNQIREFRSIISEKDDQIFGLMETISRLHRRDGEPPKPDSYFATGFSDIACSIEQWVLQYFSRGPNDPGASKISPELQVMFSMATNQLEKHLNSERIRVMSAVFAQLLWHEISSLSQDFSKCNIPGAPDTTQALRLIASEIQGNFYQHHRWRAMTMSLVAKGDDFEAGLTEYVDQAAEKLGKLLSILAPLESDNILRKNGLRAIVDKGAKLAIEIRKQPDWIYLDQVLPGTLFHSKYMEDISSQYTENELEMGKASVQIQVFPSVLRFPCDWDEDSPTLPVVVMKAKIISELPLSGEALRA